MHLQGLRGYFFSNLLNMTGIPLKVSYMVFNLNHSDFFGKDVNQLEIA